MLPSVTTIRDHAAASGLQLDCVEHFGASYGQTIAAWRERFLSGLPQLAKLGFDDMFRRKWEYYFAYCETGFRLGTLDVGLYQFRGSAG